MHAHYFKHFSGVHFEGKYFIGTFLRRNSVPGGYSGNDQRIFLGIEIFNFGMFGGWKILVNKVWGSVI